MPTTAGAQLSGTASGTRPKEGWDVGGWGRRGAVGGLGVIGGVAGGEDAAGRVVVPCGAGAKAGKGASTPSTCNLATFVAQSVENLALAAEAVLVGQLVDAHGVFLAVELRMVVRVHEQYISGGAGLIGEDAEDNGGAEAALK